MKVVHVRMPPEMIEWLKKKARDEHADVSHLLRVLVFKWMAADPTASSDSP